MEGIGQIDLGTRCDVYIERGQSSKRFPELKIDRNVHRVKKTLLRCATLAERGSHNTKEEL